jgi:hypothetical protein
MLVYILWAGLSLGLISLAMDDRRRALEVRVSNRKKLKRDK